MPVKYRIHSFEMAGECFNTTYLYFIYEYATVLHSTVDSHGRELIVNTCHARFPAVIQFHGIFYS